MTIIWHPVPKDEAILKFQLPQPGTVLSAIEAKRVAHDIAFKGLSKVKSNPLVGAVITSEEGHFLSAGAHEYWGGAHAEINALKALEAQGLSAKGTTLYLSLEPCSHYGKTPPCALEIVKSGVKRLIYGVRDPNPKVNGAGLKILRDAGVEVISDDLWQNDCQDLAEVFFTNTICKRPFVAIKAATSLDAIVARPGDRRAWITGQRARQYGHFLRICYDAILVGATTLIQDNPRLDPRDSLVPGSTPWRIVLDPNLRVCQAMNLDQLNILQVAPEKVIWCASDAAWITDLGKTMCSRLEKLGAKHLAFKMEPAGIAPMSLLKSLQDLEISSLLVEGGGRTYAPFLKREL